MEIGKDMTWLTGGRTSGTASLRSNEEVSRPLPIRFKSGWPQTKPCPNGMPRLPPIRDAPAEKRHV
jgi:hypothetical protein